MVLDNPVGLRKCQGNAVSFPHMLPEALSGHLHIQPWLMDLSIGVCRVPNEHCVWRSVLEIGVLVSVLKP